MRTIVLHGRLGRKFGGEFRLAVSTVAEAMRALGSQMPGFYEELKKGSYEVIRGDRKKGFWLSQDDISGFNLGNAELHIVPVARGSKNNGGTLKVVLGVALFAAAVFFSGGTLAAPLAGLLTSAGGLTFAGNVAVMGLAMALTGVSQMLTPDKKAEENKQTQSYSISGPGNTTSQGAPVQLVYGECICGSILISAGLDIEPIPIGWDPLAGDTTVYAGDPTS